MSDIERGFERALYSIEGNLGKRGEWHGVVNFVEHLKGQLAGQEFKHGQEVGSYETELAAVKAERDRLQWFKDFVHGRLDAAGVPTDPQSPHGEEQCRVGLRLDLVLPPADDTEPVTDEWLRAVGFRPKNFLYFNSTSGLSVAAWNHGPWLVFIDGRWCLIAQGGVCEGLADQPTRGDVRRLCAALNMTPQAMQQEAEGKA